MTGASATSQDAFVELVHTADILQRQVEALLKQAGLSASQYNVLRILRGAGPRGLCCHEVGGRMITRDPDITRLFTRMETKGLIERWRHEKDHRVVMARITKSGRALLGGLDAPIEELHRRQLNHLGTNRLKQLVELLRLATNR